jgi:hypothetical protein
MSTATTPTASAAPQPRDPDRLSSAGRTPDPWEECARLKFGGDRSHATAVRTRVIAAPPDARPRVEDRLLKSLEVRGRTDAGLAFLCEMLALVGTAKCVAALAGLVRDPATAESARFALEAIPGPEASAALREALPRLSGPAKAGLIGSLAIRGDIAARAALLSLKDAAGEPPVVREAATRALAHLAGGHGA